MNYNLNYRNIILNLIPSFLRPDKFVNLLYSLIKALKDVNTNFYLYVTNIKYLLLFNSQVIYIEKYLNDIYDPALSRIYIISYSKLAAFIFRRIEQIPQYTYVYKRSETGESYYTPTYIRRRNEGIYGFVNYIVYIPTELVPKIVQIRASVNILNPADKVFDIIDYSYYGGGCNPLGGGNL